GLASRLALRTARSRPDARRARSPAATPLPDRAAAIHLTRPPLAPGSSAAPAAAGPAPQPPAPAAAPARRAWLAGAASLALQTEDPPPPLPRASWPLPANSSPHLRPRVPPSAGRRPATPTDPHAPLRPPPRLRLRWFPHAPLSRSADDRHPRYLAESLQPAYSTN